MTVDAAFSDIFQSTSIFTTPVLVGAGGFSQGVVGVIPFVWVVGTFYPGTPPPAFTNITDEASQCALLSVATLSQFTGNPADAGTPVQVFGTDASSSERPQAFDECGFGFFSSPVQYDPTIFGGTITSIDYWHGQFTDGISYAAGTQGFSSELGVATALNTPGMLTAANNPGVMIGYLGISDASFVVNGRILQYDGVPYSPTNVEQGVYPLWSYEHIYYRSSYSGTGKTVVDQLAAQMHASLANTTGSGLLITSMAVGRQVEGGMITLGNPY